MLSLSAIFFCALAYTGRALDAVKFSIAATVVTDGRG
jgi:hypothetical protein